MSKKDRDSGGDIRDYLADLSTIMRRADPAFSAKINREALDDPELVEALAERRKLLAERGEAGERESAPSTGAADAARVSAPSPWAGGGSAEVDPRALPSANAPKAEVQLQSPVPPVTSPVPRAKPHGRRAWPRRVYVLAAAIILSPVLMWIVVSRVPRQASELPASASATAATASAAPTASQATSAAPSASASEPVKTAEPVLAPPSSTPVRPKPRSTAEDPYDAAPPAPTVAPTVAPSATSVPAPSATSPKIID